MCLHLRLSNSENFRTLHKTRALRVYVLRGLRVSRSVDHCCAEVHSKSPYIIKVLLYVIHVLGSLSDWYLMLYYYFLVPYQIGTKEWICCSETTGPACLEIPRGDILWLLNYGPYGHE